MLCLYLLLVCKPIKLFNHFKISFWIQYWDTFIVKVYLSYNLFKLMPILRNIALLYIKLRSPFLQYTASRLYKVGYFYASVMTRVCALIYFRKTWLR